MPDYNLFGLSPRSFEQLVQALSVKIIGPDAVSTVNNGPAKTTTQSLGAWLKSNQRQQEESGEPYFGFRTHLINA